MSSAAYITWDTGEGIPRERWDAFCAEHHLVYSPNTIGRNIFYAGEVEAKFGTPSYTDLPVLPNGQLDFSAATPPDYAERITISTFHFGGAMADVARIAAALWHEHGGKLDADPEIRTLLLRGMAA